MKKMTALISLLIVAGGSQALATERFNQCIKDLCGPSQRYDRIRGKGAFEVQDRDTKALLQSQVNPQLNAMMEQALQNKKMQYDLADKVLRQSDLRLSREQRGFLTVQVYFARIGANLPTVLTSTDGRVYQVNQSILSKTMPELSYVEAFSMTNVLNAYLGSTEFQSANAVESYDLDTFIEVINQQNPQAAREYFENMYRVAPELKAIAGPTYSALVDEEILRALSLGQSLRAVEKPIAIKTIATVLKIAAMTSNKILMYTDLIAMSLKEAATQMKWSERYAAVQKGTANRSLIDQQEQTVLTYCGNSVTSALAATPSELRQRKTDELLEQVKRAVLTVSPRYFSGDTLEAVRDIVGKTRFMKPTTRVETRGQVMDLFKFHSERQTRLGLSLKKYERQLDVTVAFAALTESLEEALSLFDSTIGLCGKMRPKIFVDAAMPWLNVVRSGWQTNMFPEMGVGILSHEMAHIVSGVVKLQGAKAQAAGYEETRQCAIEGHAKLAGKTNLKPFEQYAEEDWADAFASTTITELAKKWPYSENYSCALVYAVGGTPDLELQDDSGTDVHSSSFLRALQTQVQLGKALPASCQSALTAVEKEVITRSCAK